MLPPYLGGNLSRHTFLAMMRSQGVEMRETTHPTHGRQIFLVRQAQPEQPVHFCFTDGTMDGLIDAMNARLLTEQAVELCWALGVDPQLFGFVRSDGDV